MRRLTILTIALALVALFIAGCGSGGNPPDDGTTTEWPRVQELGDQDITPIPLQSEIVVGDRRFNLGLLDSESQDLILGANVSMAFYTIKAEEGTLQGETPATYVGLIENFVHEHEGDVLHTHEGAEVGGYVAQFTFQTPGDWGVELTGAIDGEPFDPVRFRFDVLERGAAPAIGDPAPRSEQPTVRDVAGISDIDSSNPPRPELHEMTVAEALDTGKPVVVSFATPAFCTSRLCGPVLDQVVVPVWEEYKDRAAFIHIEPYDLARARNGEGLIPVPAMVEWGLQTEPWVFVIDREGRVAARFEGISSAAELEAALQALLR